MIYLASDHAGFRLKEKIKKFLDKKKISFEDLGPLSFDKNDDYPDYALKATRKIKGTNNKGVLICGTGQGMCIAANKVKGIRAVSVWNVKTARHAKEHLNANIICLAGFFGEAFAEEMIIAWSNSKFQGGRHLRRLKKLR